MQPVATASSRPGSGFAHLPALDGLRGVAVALVLVGHFEPDLLPGGFLGVDVFFVLSGFLITSLLVDEASRRGTVALGRFWVRRVRRLAPALLLVLAAVAAYAAWWATPSELPRLRQHGLWTLGYLANWRYIVDGTTYTDVSVGASPLRHTWSLAIEEQFYLVFPLVVVAVAVLVGRDGLRLRRVLVAAAAAGTLASATWLAWQAGHASVARGYFGTDTRVHSLLVGVVLGALLVGRPPRSGPAARLAALAALVAVPFLLVTFALADEEDGWLPRGGFLLVAVAVAVVIAASERSWWLAGALSWRPLVALGLISYGVYLWHWPVLVVLDAERTGLDGVALFAVRLAVTLAAAVLSFVLVERPIRLGALGRSYGRRALLVAPVAAAVVVVALVAATVLPERPSSADEVAEARREQEASRPTVTVPAGPVPVTLFGDSVAHTLAGAGVEPAFQPETWTPAMDPFDPAAVDLAVATRPGCSFLPGEMRIPDGNGGTNAVDLTTRCTGWEAGVDLVLASNPDGFLVVALANDATDRVVDGRDVALDGREGRDLVADLLDDLRAMARSHGSDLALVALPPRLQRWAITGPGPDDQDARMRAVYEAYAEDHDDVVVLDLYDVLCPDADCGRPAAGFDPAWRYDGLHFTTDGAVWVANWLASELGGAAAERAGQTSGQG